MAEKLQRLKVAENLKSLGIVVFTPREFAGIFNVLIKRAINFISTNLSSGLFAKIFYIKMGLRLSRKEWAGAKIAARHLI